MQLQNKKRIVTKNGIQLMYIFKVKILINFRENYMILRSKADKKTNNKNNKIYHSNVIVSKFSHDRILIWKIYQLK